MSLSVSFLDPETDLMDQFLGPVTNIWARGALWSKVVELGCQPFDTSGRRSSRSNVNDIRGHYKQH